MRLLCGRQLVQALAAQERLSAVAGFSGRTTVLQQLQPRRHACSGKRGSLRPVQARLACVSSMHKLLLASLQPLCDVLVTPRLACCLPFSCSFGQGALC